jgi:hypothetical protein
LQPAPTSRKGSNKRMAKVRPRRLMRGIRTRRAA